MAEPEATAPVRSHSLRRDFARLLVLAILAPALLLTGFVTWRDAAFRRAQLGERLASAAQSTARDVDDFLAAHLAAITVLAERRSQAGNLDDLEAWNTDFVRMRRYYRGFSTLLATDPGGTIRASVPDVAGTGRRSVRDREYFQVPARTGRPHVSNTFRGRVLGTDPLIAVSGPLVDARGFAGVVEGSIPTNAFAPLRGTELRRRGYEMLLLDRANAVIHATGGLPFSALQVLPAARADAIAGAPGAKTRRLRRVDAVLRDGGDAYAATASLDSGWRLVLLVPKRELDDELWRHAGGLLLLLALVAGSTLGVAWLLLRSLARGTGQLLERMQRLALDRATEPLDPTGMPREMALLAIAMNRMSARLHEAYRRVSDGLQEQQRLRQSLEVALDEREREIAERTIELRRAVAELDRLSRTDPLTGCLNVRGLHEFVVPLWQELRLTASPLGLLALDVDHFKPFNDRYGHPAGDAALKRVVGAIRSALHGARDEVARPGGEEFLVLLPDADAEQAAEVAERIRMSVREADIPHDATHAGRLTVSIGVAVVRPDDGDTFEAAAARADEALYRAKAKGRDCVSE
jgi:diguanylate cyclase (GGDEF)-like protein